MNYKFTLQCKNCGNGASKEYNESEATMKKILRAANIALSFPQFLVCPKCLGIMTVKTSLERIN